MEINVGNVRVFKDIKCDKTQALKPLEEAAEVFAEWQHLNRCDDDTDDESRALIREMLIDEITDCIQACINLASTLGVDDMSYWIERCEKRNADRKRY